MTWFEFLWVFDAPLREIVFLAKAQRREDRKGLSISQNAVSEIDPKRRRRSAVGAFQKRRFVIELSHDVEVCPSDKARHP